MSFAPQIPAPAVMKALNLARSERLQALSAREWKHRMAGLGYGIRETTHGPILTDLIAGQDLCTLPADLAG